LLPYGERAIIVAVKKLKRAPTPAAAAPTTPREPITFRVNVILPSPEKWSLTAEPGSGRFLVAGASSPWRDLSEVSESLRAFIGQPDPPPFEQEALEAEQEAIRDSSPETLLRGRVDEFGWQTVHRLIAAMERNEIRSLCRPIEIGEPGTFHTMV